MSAQRFRAVLVQSGPHVHLALPFDPNAVWGDKERHYVAGSINDHRIRGCIDADRDPPELPLGPAWLRDNEVPIGETVEVILEPDGHQVEDLAPDVADALNAAPDARAFFESVAPFYRNNFIRSIESAKRPETRRKRIAEMIESLQAGRKG